MANSGDSIWIAGYSGMVCYNKNTGKVRNANKELFMNDNSTFLGVAEDNSGNLWIGTKEYQLYKCNDVGIEQYRGSSTDILPITYPCAFASDSDDNMFVGEAHSFYYDIKGSKNLRISDPSAAVVGSRYITDLAFDKYDNLWIAYDGSDGLRVQKAGKNNAEYLDFAIASVPTLTVDATGCIWYFNWSRTETNSTDKEGIHRYDPKTSTDTYFDWDSYPDIPRALYTDCAVDTNGNIWFISSHYLLKYDGTAFTWYNCYGFDEARSVMCDGESVWVYTAHEDLFRFKDNKFTSINIKAQLSGIDELGSEAEETEFLFKNIDGVLQIDGNAEISRLSLYNTAATQVVELSGLKSTQATIKAENLTSGIYILRIYHNKGITTLKINI